MFNRYEKKVLSLRNEWFKNTLISKSRWGRSGLYLTQIVFSVINANVCMRYSLLLYVLTLRVKYIFTLQALPLNSVVCLFFSISCIFLSIFTLRYKKYKKVNRNVFFCQTTVPITWSQTRVRVPDKDIQTRNNLEKLISKLFLPLYDPTIGPIGPLLPALSLKTVGHIGIFNCLCKFLNFQNNPSPLPPTSALTFVCTYWTNDNNLS